MRAFFAVSLSVFFAIAALPQTTAPAFEVASVKLSDMPAGSWFRFLPGGRLSAMSWIKQVIQVAYGVEDYQVTGGPGWLSTDRYDIEAKSEDPAAGKPEMTVMLQSLLADRFKLKFRRETRDVPVYDLVVGKSGLKVKPLKDGEASACRKDNSFACGITNPTQLAKSLRPFAGRPVLDKTGLEGKFDLLLNFDSSPNQADSDNPSLFQALEQQLGLRLEPRMASLPVLVIESIQRPSEN